MAKPTPLSEYNDQSPIEFTFDPGTTTITSALDIALWRALRPCTVDHVLLHSAGVAGTVSPEWEFITADLYKVLNLDLTGVADVENKICGIGLIGHSGTLGHLQVTAAGTVATAGSWTLTIDDIPITFQRATASDNDAAGIAARLLEHPNIDTTGTSVNQTTNDVSVVQSVADLDVNDGVITLTFGKNFLGKRIKTETDFTTLTGNAHTVTHNIGNVAILITGNATAATSGTYDVTVVTGTTTGGTLSTTAQLAFDNTPAENVTALEALANVPVGSVIAAEAAGGLNANNGTWTLTIGGNQMEWPLSVTGSEALDNNPAAEVFHVAQYGTHLAGAVDCAVEFDNALAQISEATRRLAKGDLLKCRMFDGGATGDATITEVDFSGLLSPRLYG